ncbi:hypothetical protein HIM_10627 [Hirsutella minnesotensis 3608]|uniref:Uncharacterized protein n=1 Tax=Hirsutella minnesotensis 3608 TaxID=1043627 RepID=A0A0F7ZX25_9HYPO|nr:hypothetical protein HIM_10627 [Hirsutella minnesotensis 3608]
MAQFSTAFEEANFCAGATQIHTHSPTCLKYSLGRNKRRGGLCRFKAPWKLIERTSLTADGVLEIRRTHPMVNRWNKAMAIGLRHNHDISFIATQRKTMALVYYVTNYATKVEDPIWKRVAAAAELLPAALTAEPRVGCRGGSWRKDQLRGCLRPSRRCLAEPVPLRLRIPREAPARQRKGRSGTWGEMPFDSGWASGKEWVQVLRRPGKLAVVCLDGYLSKDFGQRDEEVCRDRAAVPHLALFVPWESFLEEEEGTIGDIWARARASLQPRISCLVDNVQLLRRSAEDAKRDAKQWAASSGDTVGAPPGEGEELGHADKADGSVFQSDDVGNATRLLDVLRSAAGASQITAGSR